MVYSPIKKDGTPKLKPGRKPIPREPSTFIRRAPRPHIWKCGPDADRHRMYQPWLCSKAQANFRQEEWTLTFEEYYELWREDWDNRGRMPENMCMTRKDKEGAWEVDNVHIITRKEHLIEQGRARTGQRMTYNPRYSKMKVSR
jgi:hypothetical protein